jgi:hypothetical protein
MKHLLPPVKAITLSRKNASIVADWILQYFALFGTTIIIRSKDVVDKYIMSRSNERNVKLMPVKNTSLIRVTDKTTVPRYAKLDTKKRKLLTEEDSSGSRVIRDGKKDESENIEVVESEDEL